MDSQQQQANEKGQSFLQAKWFSPAIATLALVIAIGGHAFTAINTVGTVGLSTKLSTLETLPLMMQESDTKQDQAIRALQAEISNLSGVLAAQQRKIAALEGNVKSVAQTSVNGEYKALNETALAQREASETEKQPLKNGVNQQFDNLVRNRIKANWIQPPVRTDEERADDEDIVVLLFAVERNGWITDVSIANTSGVMDFDNAVIEAALRTSSIPEIARASDQVYSQVKTFRLEVSPAHMR